MKSKPSRSISGPPSIIGRSVSTSAVRRRNSATLEKRNDKKTHIIGCRVIDAFCLVETFGDSLKVTQRYPSNDVRGYTNFPDESLCLFLADIWKTSGRRTPPSPFEESRCKAVSFVIPEATGMLYFVSSVQVMGPPGFISSGNSSKQYICLISRAPVIQFMENVLLELASLCNQDLCPVVALEPFVRCIIAEVPCPPTDRCMKIFWERKHIFQRWIRVCFPRMRRLPLTEDRGIQLLFTRFTPEVVVNIVEHILAEDSIILYAQEVSNLAPLAEALRAIVFPFVWQGVYLPYLPKSEWRVLQSSSPYLVGVCCEATSDFRVRLHATSPYQRQTAKRFLLINAVSGTTETICRAPGLERRFASSFLSLAADMDDQTEIQIEPVQPLPEPVRGNLLQCLKTILGCAVDVDPHSLAAKSMCEIGFNQTRVSTPTSSGTASSGGSRLGSSFSAATPPHSIDSIASQESEGSDLGAVSSDDRVWCDHVRIAFLEVFLSLMSHLKYHLVPLEDDSIEIIKTETDLNRIEPQQLIERKTSDPEELKSRPKSSVSKAGFDPEGFLLDLPQEFRGFVRPLISTRLFCDLVSRQVVGGQGNVFDGFVTVWRNQALHNFKRKVSPTMRKLQGVLTELGYSLASSRVAVEQLLHLNREDMDVLFGSVHKLRETLDHLGIQRYIVEEDSMSSKPNNARTRKLRELLQRAKQRERPPLVCRISLTKHHKDVKPTWYNQPEKIGHFPILRPELVHASTVATLVPYPLRTNPGEKRSAKMTSLALMSAFIKGGVHNGEAIQPTPGPMIGELVRVVSTGPLADMEEDETERVSSGKNANVMIHNPTSRTVTENHASKLRAVRWSENQSQLASEDATETLLSHMEATETVHRSISKANRQKIDQLEQTVSAKDLRIQQLEQQLAVLAAGVVPAARPPIPEKGNRRHSQSILSTQDQPNPTRRYSSPPTVSNENQPNWSNCPTEEKPKKDESRSPTIRPNLGRKYLSENGALFSKPLSIVPPSTSSFRAVERRNSPLFADRRNIFSDEPSSPTDHLPRMSKSLQRTRSIPPNVA
mmetsp:Transcript_22726/g.36218  ORF Transcript_22726/g.36218 Transcript_22726/m.36218 type:complete len:1055 (-) Transcript_22726:5184-8348(-)|eukprot:CAMPEP_0203752168 /NCGR_PEP_ID=MMETSP0098-20131031/6126_1 /ASSEMBLY_ACC=CAM_ASM_000208 /TAXON_ID=96639 /ORGANISM=" , Strain NY0313808BC1" /LENGTH=1054 /DNA_ID=CAMNT_0050642207 /DNA_START=287 /DNA_END=3451 /DNA_ORIENTATION=+